MKTRQLLFTSSVFDYIAGYDPKGEDNYQRGLEAVKAEIAEMVEDFDNASEDQVWNICYGWIDENWKDLVHNLINSEADGKCVITGSLGLWSGRPTIYPEVVDSLWKAIEKCNGGNGDIAVWKVNGHLEVNYSHHDGTNCFEIHLLSKKGLEAWDRIEYGTGNADLNNRTYHKAMPEYLY